MSQDIRSFFSKKKVKVRYDCNSVTAQRKERKQRIEKGPKQQTIESLGRVIIIEEFNRCKGTILVTIIYIFYTYIYIYSYIYFHI